MTIEEIKHRTKKTSPLFFAPATMKMWNQQLSDFKVIRRKDGKYYLWAESITRLGRHLTERVFDPATNELLFVSSDRAKMEEPIEE